VAVIRSSKLVVVMTTDARYGGQRGCVGEERLRSHLLHVAERAL